MRQVVTYGAGLIFAYLALSWATNGGRLLTSGAAATSTVVKTLQGR